MSEAAHRSSLHEEPADYILTNHILSKEFFTKLTEVIPKDTKTICLADLKDLAFFKLLKYLRGLKVKRLFLPIEDENGAIILPILKMVAVFIPARSIEILYADLKPVRFYRVQVFASSAQLIWTSFSSYLQVRRARKEVASLLRQERITHKMGSNHLLYLNANLWSGLKAGGSVGHISGVINAFSQLGFPVHFASASGRLMAQAAIAYEPLLPPRYFGFPIELNYYRFHFCVAHQLKELAATQSFGLIYQRLSLANYSGVVLSRALGLPLIMEYNGSEAWIAANWGKPLREQQLAFQIEEINLKHAHLIVTISKALRDELLARQIPPERIVTYPNCIDPEIFRPERIGAEARRALRKCHGIDEESLVLTFVGTFGQWHGIEVLAKAIRLLIDQDQEWLKISKLHFLLVGNGLKMPLVREILGSDADGPFVTLTGLVPQHEAPEYLAISDILASPHVPNADGSPFFGSPTKLFEYMAMGKAIIASDLDQIGEVLAGSLCADHLPTQAPSEVPRASALLCQPGSVDDIVKALRFLVEHPQWRKHLGANARKLALENYTWEHHVRAILAQANHFQLLVEKRT